MADSRDRPALADDAPTASTKTTDVPRPWPLELTVLVLVGAMALWEIVLLALVPEWSPNWTVFALLGTTNSHCGLLLLWAALGSGLGLVRWLLAGFVWFSTAAVLATFSSFPRGFSPSDLVLFSLFIGGQMLILGIPLLLMRRRGWRWTARVDLSEREEPLQYSLAQLFALVTLSAVLLGVARLFNVTEADAPDMQPVLSVALWVGCLGVGQFAAFAAMLPPRGSIKFVMGAFVAPLFSGQALRFLEEWARGPQHDSSGVVIVPIVASMLTVLVLSILHRAGLKLTKVPRRSPAERG